MPRKPRIHYNHAMYHVMLQGNYKQNLFYEDTDYLKMYKLFEKVTIQYKCKIHLFCLMTNHIHLVIQVKNVSLAKIMQSITPAYSNYLNKKFNKHGHLFRGRYLSKIIEDEKYVFELCYYIHNNPIKANIAHCLNNYPWSSHHCYSNKGGLNWVTTKYIKTLLVRQVDTNNPYIDFMLDRENTYKEPKFCTLDKDGQLIILDTVSIAINSVETLDLTTFSLQKIIDTVCKYQNISLDLLRCDSKKEIITISRTLVTFFAHYNGRYLMKDIAFALYHPPGTISKTLHRQFNSEKKNKILDYKINQLERIFSNLLIEKKRIRDKAIQKNRLAD